MTKNEHFWIYSLPLRSILVHYSGWLFRWKPYIILLPRYTKSKITFHRLLWHIFTFRENSYYNLRSGIYLASRNIRTTLVGKETISNLVAKNGSYCETKKKVLHPYKFLKIKWKKTLKIVKIETVHVGFVRHTLKTRACQAGVCVCVREGGGVNLPTIFGISRYFDKMCR